MNVQFGAHSVDSVMVIMAAPLCSFAVRCDTAGNQQCRDKTQHQRSENLNVISAEPALFSWRWSICAHKNTRSATLSIGPQVYSSMVHVLVKCSTSQVPSYPSLSTLTTYHTAPLCFGGLGHQLLGRYWMKKDIQDLRGWSAVWMPPILHRPYLM